MKSMCFTNKLMIQTLCSRELSISHQTLSAFLQSVPLPQKQPFVSSCFFGGWKNQFGSLRGFHCRKSLSLSKNYFFMLLAVLTAYKTDHCRFAQAALPSAQGLEAVPWAPESETSAQGCACRSPPVAEESPRRVERNQQPER